MPAINIENTEIEVVKQLKILGVQITSDLKWKAKHYKRKLKKTLDLENT